MDRSHVARKAQPEVGSLAEHFSLGHRIDLPAVILAVGGRVDSVPKEVLERKHQFRLGNDPHDTSERLKERCFGQPSSIIEAVVDGMCDSIRA
jgi:hypothetical protein